MSSKMDDKTYLKYLFQSLNLKELKQICKDLGIKGFSKYKKADLIDFIIGSVSDEEIKEILERKELEIISNEINEAIDIIGGKGRESISEIRLKNSNKHEIEVDFKGFKWETGSYIAITKDNIFDPERDCDCRTGSEGGFCPHFWVGFILSLKQKYFKLSEWKLTKLPKDFKEKIKSISISKLAITGAGEDASKTESPSKISLIDKSSDVSKATKYLDSRITVYEGEIKKIIEQKAEFEGHVTNYYILSLDNVKVGPQLKKKSDYDEGEIITISSLNARASEKNYKSLSLKEGDKISCNGGLNKDNYWGLLLKRVSKIKKVK